MLLPDHSSGAAFFDVFMAFTDFIPFFIAAMLLFLFSMGCRPNLHPLKQKL